MTSLNFSIRLTEDDALLLDHVAERMARTKGDAIRILVKRAAADPNLSEFTTVPPVIVRVNPKEEQE